MDVLISALNNDLNTKTLENKNQLADLNVTISAHELVIQEHSTFIEEFIANRTGIYCGVPPTIEFQDMVA